MDKPKGMAASYNVHCLLQYADSVEKAERWDMCRSWVSMEARKSHEMWEAINECTNSESSDPAWAGLPFSLVLELLEMFE